MDASNINRAVAILLFVPEKDRIEVVEIEDILELEVLNLETLILT